MSASRAPPSQINFAAIATPWEQVWIGVGQYAVPVDHLPPYALVALIAGTGVALFVAGTEATRILRPRAPSPAARLSYECGVDPEGVGWAQIYIRYFRYAFLYLIFAVDAIFLFPWATVIDHPGFKNGTILELGFFVGILALGLGYAWRNAALRWT